MSIDEAPTIAERYARAIKTSRLVVEERRRGDADMLIAAGWVEEGLASMLYRLRVEFDSVSRMEQEQAGNDETARLLVLMKLKSLPAAREALGSFARKRAAFKGLGATDSQVNAITGKALDTFLAPLCGKCDGRGFSGGYGTPQIWCNKCARSGRRPLKFSDRIQEDFARDLLSIMDRKLATMDGLMRRFLGQREG